MQTIKRDIAGLSEIYREKEKEVIYVNTAIGITEDEERAILVDCILSSISFCN